MNQTQHELINFIQKKFVNGKQEVHLTPEFDLLISGLVDSHGVLRIAAFMEKTFQIKIPPRDIIIENFRSVEAMTQYLQEKSRITA